MPPFKTDVMIDSLTIGLREGIRKATSPGC